MLKEEKEREYVSILDSLQRVKNGIVQDCQDELAMTGMMPDSAQQELKVLAGITGNVFWGFKTLGAEIYCDKDKPNIVYANIGGRTFSCGRSSLPAEAKNIDYGNEVNKEKDVTPSPVVAPVVAPIISEPIEPNIPLPEEILPIPNVQEEEKVQEKEEEAKQEKNEDKEEDTPSAPTFDYSSNAPVFNLDEEEFEEENEATESKPVFSENIPIFDEQEEDGFDDAPTVSESKEDVSVPVFDEGGVVSYEDKKESTPEPSGAVMFTPPASDEPVKVSSFSNMGDIFIEEQTKKGSEFVYTYSKITVAHKDFGSRPEEMLVLIAPLKISKYSCASVPIVVTILHKGVATTVSSYDSKENGKNMVTIDVNEFYFLVRGAFDDDGNFTPTFVTTGISANQGDIINVTYSKTFGKSTDRATRNGHIKFGYDAEAANGTVEVLPFGEIGDDDFVAIVKNDEFVDYYMISKSLRVNHRPIIYDKNGTPLELVCSWDDDTLTAELV